MSTVAKTEPLITAEEYAVRADSGSYDELVRGKIVPMCRPDLRHGQICSNVQFLLRSFAIEHDLGHVLCNDTGVITERGPDTVRGADVAFYSYARLPKGKLPRSYGEVKPDLVVEVRSKHDRWPNLLAKAAEYLEAGVSAVLVLDDETSTAQLSTADAPPTVFQADDALTIPAILPGFSVRPRAFFD